ncbi:MAG: adenylate/guanylate cyclase domain-containing protein, partial [Alphaproteobacteria bacterium]
DDETEAERFAMRAARVPVAGSPGAPPRRTRLVPPVEAIARRADAIGVAEVSGDADELVRRVAPVVIVAGEPVGSLPLRAAMRHLGVTDVRFADGELRLGDRSVPLDRDGRLVLRFRRPDPPRTPPGISFPSVHVADLLAAAFRHAEGAPIEPEDRRRFEGRIVIVGINAPGKEDVEITPVSGTFLGPEIHATAIEGLLRGDALAPWPRGSLAALVPAGLLAMATALLSILPGSPLAAALGGPALTVGWLAFAAAALRSGRLVPVFGPALGAGLALAGSNLWLYLTEGRQKREIGRMFSRYVSPEVVRELQAHPDKLRLGGERREMTAFFSDLEGFTTISESMDASTLVEFLNAYLTRCTDVILDAGGVIDKYEGDAIIAFWNAPLDQPDHARLACEAALRCQEACAAFGEECDRRGWPRPRMRIGLNTGPMVVGNMGSNRRFDYTIIGDAVNLASRLEGANKVFGTRTMASEATRVAAGEGLSFRPLGRIRVKGRDEPVAVHELVAPGAEPAWVASFRGALEAVDRGDAAAARAAFGSVLATRPDDEPSRRWLARLDREDARTLDPVWTLDEK